MKNINPEVKKVLDIIIDLPKADCWLTNEQSRGLLDLEHDFRKAIEARIQHCYNQFMENRDKAVSLFYEQIVCWEGGHFSLPTYQALIESREQKILEWPGIVWQQILRQMAADKNTDMEMINMATEMLLCADKN